MVGRPVPAVPVGSPLTPSSTDPSSPLSHLLRDPVPFATIDVGTNTAQLLVVEPNGRSLRRLHTAERFVRLGEGVDASGRVSEAAQDRLLTTLRDHKQAALEQGAERIVAVGTSALRDATNRQVVLDRVHRTLGLSLNVLSGETEAAWSFAAACSALDDGTGPCLVVDVGGGSTELVAGQDPAAHRPNYPAAIVDRTSLDIGCVRLTERCFDDQPPSSHAVEEATRIIDEALDATALTVDSAPILVGTAGTATALALVHLGPESEWDALHGGGFVLRHDHVQHWRRKLLRLSIDEIRALHPEAMAGRADVFTVGVLLLDRVLSHFDRDHLRVSPYELRHGLALRVLAQNGMK